MMSKCNINAINNYARPTNPILCRVAYGNISSRIARSIRSILLSCWLEAL